MSEVTPVPPPAERAASPWKIVLRVVLVVVALGVSVFVLVAAFDDLDLGEILDALDGLSDAELVSLASMWLVWCASQGLQTASLVPGLPVRRGVVAYLAPAAVASVVPGPSDLPVRYRMLTSWGRDRGEVTLALAANGVFTIGIKLVLPVVAAIGLLVSDAPIDGTLRTIVVIALLVGLLLLGFVVMIGSEARTARIGRWLDPVWRAVMRLMRRPDRDELAPRLLAARAQALDVLRDRWLIATWATVLTAGTQFAMLLMALRFCGVPESAVSWPQVFVVYALVQGLTVVPITAGNVGVSEVAYIGLLTAAAGEQYVNTVTAAVVVYRVLTWLVVIPVGFGAFGVWRHSTRRTSGSTAPTDDREPPTPGVERTRPDTSRSGP